LRDYPQSAVRSDGTGPSRDRMVFVLDLTNADGLFSAGEFAIQDRDLVLVTQSDLVNTRTVFGLIGSIFGLTNNIESTTQNLSN
jgi:polysaccharide export outer membrane protein